MPWHCVFLLRGIVFSHEAVRAWEAKFAPTIAAELKRRRTGKAGKRWRVDETKIAIAGQWYYLYRAIDSDGKLVDVRLSKVRDLDAAEAFFKQAVATIGHKPTQVTSDKEASYPKAIRKTLGRKVAHRTIKFLNNKLEQDHRGIKFRYKPMLGFKTEKSADRFIQAYEEQRALFRYRWEHNAAVTLPLRRVHILGKNEELHEIFVNIRLTPKATPLSVE